MSLDGNRGASTSFAGSLDGRPLAQSRHVLFLYLTDLKNTGTEVEDLHGRDGRVNIRKGGELPLLLQKGSLSVKLKHEGGALPQVWALKYDGSRAVPMAAHTTGDGMAFDAKAVTNPDVFSVFELVWKD